MSLRIFNIFVQSRAVGGPWGHNRIEEDFSFDTYKL